MKLWFSLFCILCMLFASCEDNKKQSQEKAPVVKEVKEEKPKDSVPAEKKKESLVTDPSYPKITNENAVEFFTAYGKENPETKVRVSTSYGDIDIELYEDTPLHRANFIYLVKQNYFENTFFHRIVPNFIIQGGNSDLRTTPRKRHILGKDYLLPAELGNGRKHKYGTVSGSKEYRENPDNRTAPYEFFIFLGPQSSTGHLNDKYTIFGRVTSGMKAVETIANLPHDEGDWPLQNVYISVKIIE
ncbi:peptidylprolyl isomerase [Aureisphaera galaxeae]|uniref:peptidylprolyl isomerase n=1 Tax=Aureisphaera galaxeae TaxID=1538023 RepID=UPI0023509D1A|nr:peptidylprolyl isomerase [Aureisphaera galaxeae]MDC8003536.1 peptidylprolyl isomerase [Aureisphaera galaxeae]